MKGWNLKMSLPNHLCLVKSWLRFACQLQLAKLCFQTESQLLINILCKWIWHSLEILAVSSNQDIRIYKIYCIFVIGIHVELRLFGYSDFSWNIQICNISFLPKKQPDSKNQRLLKSACQCVTFPLWACSEKFNIDFLSQNFFLASPHVYFWAKMSMLNFSRWLRNRRSSLKCQ